MRSRLLRSLMTTVGALVVLGLSGCAGQPASLPTSSGLPPRPMNLAMDGLAPCSLLTDAQRSSLQIGSGSTSENRELGTACNWSEINETEGDYSAGPVLKAGAETFHTSEPLDSVDGFAVMYLQTPGFDPRYSCDLLVDVAPGQVLTVSYGELLHKDPSINHQVSCDKAKRLASAMISTIRTRQGK